MGADPRYATMALRREHRAEIEPRIAAATAMRTVAEWEERLAAHDVPHAPVLGVSAALAHPHTAARRMVEEVEHPTAGVLSLLGQPIKFPGTEQPPLRPPRLGEHGEALWGLLGLSEAEVAGLRRGRHPGQLVANPGPSGPTEVISGRCCAACGRRPAS